MFRRAFLFQISISKVIFIDKIILHTIILKNEKSLVAVVRLKYRVTWELKWLLRNLQTETAKVV